MYKIALVVRGKAGVGAGEGYRADVDAILARVSDKTKIVFSPPEQPDRHLYPPREVRRMHKGLPATRLWCWTALTMRIRCAETTTSRAGTSRHHENTCDAHLLQDLRLARYGSDGPARPALPTC